jgi:hypothetical protein
MEYCAEIEALQCGFCGGVVRPEAAVDPMEQTEKFLLFTVDRKEAVDAYRKWLKSLGFFRPSDLASGSCLESLRALWWVGWVFDADAQVTWTADSDAGAREARWAPHAGELFIHFDDVVVPATSGLSAAECERLIPTYALASGVDQPVGQVSQVIRERFGLPRSVARTRIIEAIQRMAETRVKADAVPGSRCRNVQVAIRLRGLVNRRFAFPAYVVAYRYRGQLYRTVISGQESTCVFGTAPRSLAKVVLILIAGLLGLGAIVIGTILQG